MDGTGRTVRTNGLSQSGDDDEDDDARSIPPQSGGSLSAWEWWLMKVWPSTTEYVLNGQLWADRI